MSARNPAPIGSPRWWVEVLEETLDELMPIIDDMGETLLGELAQGWAPGVEPDKAAQTIKLEQLLGMEPTQVQQVLELMASDPQTQAKAAKLAADYLVVKGGV